MQDSVLSAGTNTQAVIAASRFIIRQIIFKESSPTLG
jgi:hypothetical protein